MNDLNELLRLARARLEPGEGEHELAAVLVDTVLGMHRPDARELLLPVVLPWVRQREGERARVRDAEQRVFDREAPARGNPSQEAMRALLAGTCYVEGHGLVAWGDMTVAFHETRIAYLKRTRDAYVSGVNATIVRHETAVGLLEESSCADLNTYAARYGSLPGNLLEETAPA